MKTIDGATVLPLTVPAATTAEPTPALPHRPSVQAIGEYLYIDGVACCPWCLEEAGSQWCVCGPDEVAAVLATAPDLPPIHIDLRGGTR